MKTKQELRNYYKTIRSYLDLETESKKIVENIIFCDFFQSAKNILTFYPLKSEVQIQSLLEVKEKNIFLPSVINNDLKIYKYFTNCELKKGKFSIYEAHTSELEDLCKLDLIIVPALCADLRGYRLGWGKGYYDRFLATLKTPVTKIIPIFEECLLLNLDCINDFDIKCDYLITQKKIIKTCG